MFGALVLVQAGGAGPAPCGKPKMECLRRKLRRWALRDQRRLSGQRSAEQRSDCRALVDSECVVLCWSLIDSSDTAKGIECRFWDQHPCTTWMM